MTVSPASCAPEQLEKLLANALGEAEQAGVIAHLDGCTTCQRSLDALAAGPRLWDEIRQLAGLETSDLAPAAEGTLDFLDPSDNPQALGRLGIYEVVALIGQGGFARVFKALDPTLNRTVAIKVLAPALASSATARLRFAREARAAAAVAHEHIVAIHAVDASRGLPYIVMQYVPGRSLQGRLNDTGPLGLKEILRIGAQTAAGLAAAHAQGLIHRDIKPANILLENCVERVKITDFGLARAVDDASVTQNGVVTGTPQYMAPEQAQGQALDGRTDLFSLGSVLYAMCTGHPPFRAETSIAVLHCVCADTPRSVRELNPEIPDWLEAIIERLHAKDPADRFDTAAEVAALLNDCLAHVQDPTRFALPPIPIHKPARGLPPAPAPPILPAGRKSVRSSRPWRIAAAGLLLVLGGLGAAEATGSRVSEFVATILRIPTRDGTLVIEVEDPEVKVTVDNQNDEITITGAGVHEVRLRPGEHQLKAVKDGKPVMTELISIARGGKQVVRVHLAPEDPPPAGRADTPDVAAEPAPRGLLGNAPVSFVADDRETWFAVFAPDGKTLATGGRSGVLNLWDVATHEPRMTSPPSNEGFRSATFSPDGAVLATGRTTGTLTLWDTRSGKPFQTLREHAEAIRSVNFAPDGARMVTTGQDRKITVWETRTWRVLRTVADLPQPILCSRISPDGTQLAVAFGDPTPSGRAGGVRLYDAATLALQGELPDIAYRIWAVAYSPDGKTLATGGSEGTNTARLWDPDTRRERSVLNAPLFVRSLAFSPDGRMLLTAGSGRSGDAGNGGGSALLWDTATLKPRAIIRRHGSLILAANFSPDSQLVATGALSAKDARVWKISGLPRASTPEMDPGAPAPGRDEPPRISEIRSGDPSAGSSPLVLDADPAQVWFAVVSPDGKTLATGGASGILKLWDVGSQRPRFVGETTPDSLHGAAFSPDGKILATGRRSGQVTLWDASSGKLLRTVKQQTGAVRSVTFSPNGRRLVSAGQDRTLSVWDTATWTSVGTLPGLPQPILATAIAPDSKLLAVALGLPLAGEGDGTVRLYDLDTLADRGALPGIDREVWSVAFAPDGRTLAVGRIRQLRLWDVAPLKERAVIDVPHNIRVLAYSRDGKKLVTAGAVSTGKTEGTALVWDMAANRPEAIAGGHAGQIQGASFSPDGRLLATASFDSTARLWDVSKLSPAPDSLALEATRAPRASESTPALYVERPIQGLQTASETVTLALAYSPDGRVLATAGEDRAITLRDARTGSVFSTIKGHADVVNGLAFSPDGKSFASASHDKTARIYSLEGDRCEVLQGHKNWVFAVAFSPDGKTLATASYDKLVKLWDVVEAREIATLEGHGASVRAVAFSPDGKTLASGGGDRTVKLWDVAGRRQRASLKGHKGAIRALVFSSDGARLATASDDHTIKLWDRAGGAELATLTGHTDMVVCLAVDPAGRFLASGSWDTTIKLWDLATGKERSSLRGHTEAVAALAFSPTGNQLASAGHDKRIKLWAAR